MVCLHFLNIPLNFVKLIKLIDFSLKLSLTKLKIKNLITKMVIIFYTTVQVVYLGVSCQLNYIPNINLMLYGQINIVLILQNFLKIFKTGKSNFQ